MTATCDTTYFGTPDGDSGSAPELAKAASLLSLRLREQCFPSCLHLGLHVLAELAQEAVSEEVRQVREKDGVQAAALSQVVWAEYNKRLDSANLTCPNHLEKNDAKTATQTSTRALAGNKLHVFPMIRKLETRCTSC